MDPASIDLKNLTLTTRDSESVTLISSISLHPECLIRQLASVLTAFATSLCTNLVDSITLFCTDFAKLRA